MILATRTRRPRADWSGRSDSDGLQLRADRLHRRAQAGLGLHRGLVDQHLGATRFERVVHHVPELHVGYVDTVMAARTTDPKVDPADLVSDVFGDSKQHSRVGTRVSGCLVLHAAGRHSHRGTSVPLAADGALSAVLLTSLWTMLFKNGPTMSMGRGKTTVEFWSAPSSSRVCR